jgi:DNA-binding XRE family transcriptional regulator
MPNPLKAARLSAGMTQKAIASATDMTPHAILRYEQGLYDQLSPKLSLFCSEHLDLLPSEVEAEYRLFQHNRRRDSAGYFLPFPNLVMSPSEHPFVYFRNVITTRAVGKKTRIGFCVLLAMNPAVVLQYEKGRTAHLPLLMVGCLRDAGVPGDKIKDLDSYGEIWHERHGMDD